MSIKRNTAYNLVGAIVPIGVSLLTVPIYLHLIGAERYGVLAITWLLLGYFGLFDLGLGTATAQSIAAAKGATRTERASIFWNAVAINLVMGLIGAVALYAAGALFFGSVFQVDPGLRGELLASLPLIAAIVPVATLGGVLTGALQGRERFLALNVLSAGFSVVSQMAPLAVAWAFGPDLSLLIGTGLLARALSLAMMAWLCRTELTHGEPRRLTRAGIASLLKFGGWVTVSSVVGPLMTILDRFVLGAVSGPLAITIYTIPFQLAQRVMFLPVALTSALFPRLSGSSIQVEQRLGRAGMLSILCVMTAPIVFGIFAIEPFLKLWIGETLYKQAAEVGRILLLGFWANGMAQVPFAQMTARRRPRVTAIVHVIELPFYLTAFYFLIQSFGLVGAAIAFALRCYSDFLIFASLALKRSVPWASIAVATGIITVAIISGRAFQPLSFGWLGTLALLMSLSLGMTWTYMPVELRRLAQGLRRARPRTPQHPPASWD